MAKITVDFSRTVRAMKPVHAVGQPPLLGWSNDSMFHFLTDAGIPYSRLHDLGGFFAESWYVDIPNIFRNFDADPDDPASYDFTWTDIVITDLFKANVEPYFRLGVSIENEVWRKAYFVNPPKDFTKWAKICAGIIRHYTKGWANGFNYKITYWEIWNEPECIDRQVMWTGTWEQYLELYGTASKLLKAEFPEIKVGGYASCGFYLISHPERRGNVRQESFIECFDKFLAYVKANNCPLDFFSWHSYDEPKFVSGYAEYVDLKLKEYGLTGVEQHLNEWNCIFSHRGRADHAAATAAFILEMQKSKVYIGMFYDAKCDVGGYGGLFNPMTLQPLKAYWAFIAFNELYKRKNEIASFSDTENVYVCAANDNGDAAVMIANYTDQPQCIDLELNGAEITRLWLTDESQDMTYCSISDAKKLPPYSFMLIHVNA